MPNTLATPAPDKQETRINAVDVHVGSRVRLRRTLLGMSQEKLGLALGLTFQQVQKYERGMNRIGASRLFDLAAILDVPISFFFDAMAHGADGLPGSPAAQGERSSTTASGPAPDVLSRPETLELVRAFHRIGEPAVRKRVLDLIRSLEAPMASPQAAARAVV